MRNRPEGPAAGDEVQHLYAKRARLYENLWVNQLGWGKQLEAFFRQYDFLRSPLKVMDAGCGTGVVTRILYKVLHEKGWKSVQFDAFDLTQPMLDIFMQEIRHQGLEHIELAQADVLKPDSLPAGWSGYDLVVSSALLEHIPEPLIDRALKNLQGLLKPGGVLLLFLTRRTIITRLAGKLFWRTNLFEEEKIKAMLETLGFHRIEFRKLQSGWSSHIIVVEARNEQG